MLQMWIFLMAIHVIRGWNITWEDYSEDILPPMYAIDDYFKCRNDHALFCRVEFFLRPNNETSAISKEIQRSHRFAYRMFRSSIYRMMCVPQGHSDGVKGYVKGVMEEELKEHNVTVNVVDYVCDSDLPKFQVYDYLVIVLATGYLWLLFKASKYDYNRRKDANYPLSKHHKWLKTFSLLENWDKATASNNNADFQKLKCIQGLRFYLMILVVTCHSKMSFGLMFLENPKTFEKFLAHPLYITSFQFDLFVIQPFYLVSAMLLTNQIYELHRKHGKFTLGHCLNLYLNRIVRFLPSMVVMMLCGLPAVKLMPRGTMMMHQVDMIWKGYGRSWWATLMQMNYLFKFYEMCMPGTWYLSVDTFFYLTTIILLYIQLKYKLDAKKVIPLAFLATSLNFAYIIYTKDLDIMFRPTAERIRRIFDSPEFQSLYLSPLSSWNTCCVGVAMGAIFYHTKNRKIDINMTQQLPWYGIVLLPLPLTIAVSFYNFQGVQRALVGPLLKPISALASGMCILGMSRGYGGVLKRIFEWDFAVTMSNFTFCTYVYHFFFIFGRGMADRELFRFKEYYLVIYLVSDLLLSFAIGIVMTIVVEMPGLSLQKMYVPQIKKKTDDNTAKTD